MKKVIETFYHWFDWHVEFERDNGKKLARAKGNMLAGAIVVTVIALIIRLIDYII